MTNLQKFEDYNIVDVSKEDISLGEDDEEAKKKDEELTQSFGALTDWMKEVLGDEVEKVVVSKRISDTPAIVVTSKFGWSANMERIMKSQAMGDTRSMEYMKGRKILEISPTSPVILDMKSKVEGDDKSEDVMDAVRLLYETSMITSGFEVPDPLVQVDAAGVVANAIQAPMPGLVQQVFAQAGQAVTQGEPLLVLEAMKMEHRLGAPRDGVVLDVLAVEGDQVADGTVLVRLEPIDD